MLTKIPQSAAPVRFEKRVRGRDRSDKNAFFADDVLTLRLFLPRAYGAAAVVLRIKPDGGDFADRPFAFTATAGGVDLYALTLPLTDLCGAAGCGLFWYTVLLCRGADTLFAVADADGVSYTFERETGRLFRLLVAKAGFDTPARFKGRTMYHVFVDRFAKGQGPVSYPAGALVHRAWDEPVLQYGERPGDFVRNNEFFGGSLWGVAEKLDYLASLGVNALYLSPIFKAASNHKYDTGDYETVDPGFGGEAALRELLDACRARGMDVLLDGVFNHTGDDSRYFNKYGRYPETGAAQSERSPYAGWYNFRHFPDDYECWWNVPILPRLDLGNPAVTDYLLSVVARYDAMGVAGWRLDVADELPDGFLDDLRRRVKADTGGNGVILGEVWENAADKIAYGRRRRYLQGDQLDGVMNYPLRGGIVSFVRDGDAPALAAVLRGLWASYPTPVCHALMNVLSTHDTERILTVLGGEPAGERSGTELSTLAMKPAARKIAVKRLTMAATLQYTVFGVPSLYYGDEAGMEGYRDPFCRRPYPWGREDKALLDHYKKLGRLRGSAPCLSDGDFRLLSVTEGAICFLRGDKKDGLVVAANRGKTPFSVTLPAPGLSFFGGDAPVRRAVLPPDTFDVWRILPCYAN